MGGRQGWAQGKSSFLILLVVTLDHLPLDLPSGRGISHLPYRAVGSPELPHCLPQRESDESHFCITWKQCGT